MSATDTGSSGTRLRLRVRFSKLGKIRWTSHRDVARMWERAFRRIQLQLAYSEGFSPRPKVSFGLALPTGYESVAEYLDIDLSDFSETDLPALPGKLSEALPVGVDATAVSVIEPKTPSLQEDVLSCTWRFVAAPAEGCAPLTVSVVGERVASILASESVEVTRNRKGAQVTEDIRGGVLELRLIGPAGPDLADGVELEAELAAQPRSVRPAEVVAAIGPEVEERLVRRTHQWILRDGARREPLAETAVEAPGDATQAPHALERAS